MLQCKIFAGGAEEVERNVNQFLGDHTKLLIHSVHQSCDHSRVHVTLFFDVRTRSAKMKEAAMHEVAIQVEPGKLQAN